MYLTYILIIVPMIILSAFFSGAEMAFNASNAMRLKKAADSGSFVAKLAFKIRENFTWTLSTILIGNNLVNIAASTAATSLAILIFTDVLGMPDKAESLGATLATVILTIIVLIFGEICPKILAKQHADRLSCIIVIPIRILTILLFPLVGIVMLIVNLFRKLWGKGKQDDEPTVTEEELVSIIDTVEEEGVIDESQSELLQSSIAFQDTNVEEIMTPRIDMTAIDLTADSEKSLATIRASIHSRIPVYEETIDNIVGVLILNHYYRATVGETVSHSNELIRELMIPACFIHKTMKLPAAIELLREKETHIAIVIDEFGGTLGIVTMEDILEELVGDIWDESDTIVNEIVQTGENTYEVLGEMAIYDFFDEIDFSPTNFECEYSTMAGWAIEALNANPHIGDHFSYENLYLVVTEMDDLCVTKLTALVNPVDTTEEDA